MVEATVRCAPQSQARGEALVATASRVQRWLVVEQPGAWGADALSQSRLDPDTAAALAADARIHGVRVLLARRPGQRSLRSRRAVFLAHSGVERRWIERVDLDAADHKALLGLDLGSLVFPDPPGLGRPAEPAPTSMHLVCTNGRHDPCCADFGRPVVRALVDAHAPDVWECSHVGGDRFAANIVCLPEGVYYGRVDADGAAGLLADHRAGLVDLACYRGRSCYPPLVQAADGFAREHLAERRLDGLSVLSADRRGEGIAAVRVQQRDGEALEVTVGRERASEPAQLTCHGQPGLMWRYRLVDIRSL